ncbi:iron-sulfur cluster co-chaperone protein HscB isoform X2 [Conger conger]|uniref:iron-sulfur cluster co-chaperone protein HscB isoform X2 n=1 Tax=Conger conger TaxID=82655 RepID=UPI002A5A241B|nr:iron-sulfur cluster co-chaperone protein HscB isoform X2 [Conger conger]
MQALNTLRWICSSRCYQNANGFGKYIVNILPSSSNAVLNAELTLHNKYITGNRGLCNTTSQLLGRFNANQAVYTNQSRTFSTVLDKCWKCECSIQVVPVFFCPACKVIQAPDDHATYFDIMDCDKAFALDTQKLQRRYLYLQRSLHPDNFSQKTQKEQEYSETQSALVSKAYRTLLKPLSRGIYMLELGGVPVEEGTDIGADQQFLLDIMEINERLEETQSKEEVDNIGFSVEGDVSSAKLLIGQMKYFVNIREKVKEKLSEMLV